MINFIKPPITSLYYQRMAENGVELRLDPMAPSIVAFGIEYSLKHAIVNLSVNGVDKTYVYNSGNSIYSANPLEFFGSCDTLCIGKSDIVTESGEQIDDHINIFFPNGSGVIEVLSADNPNVVFGLFNLFAEASTGTGAFGIAATVGYDAHGNPVIFWELTDDRNRLNLYYYFSDATAQLIARYAQKEGTIQFSLEGKQGGQT